jgi:hypothetical protein
MPVLQISGKAFQKMRREGPPSWMKAADVRFNNLRVKVRDGLPVLVTPPKPKSSVLPPKVRDALKRFKRRDGLMNTMPHKDDSY